MATQTGSRTSRRGGVPAVVQWTALAVAAVLAVVAAFVFFGEGTTGGGGGHSGLAPVAVEQG